MSKKLINPGVGMPATLLLDQFGYQVNRAFGTIPFLVGSALFKKDWHDVDIRLILTDDEYEKSGFGNPRSPHTNAKWVSLCLAYSALGKQMTGLPIDFQIQQQTQANREHDKERSALGIEFGLSLQEELKRFNAINKYTEKLLSEQEAPMDPNALPPAAPPASSPSAVR